MVSTGLDKTLVCKECKKEFVFTTGEQEFYAQKGLENEPSRCPECRLQKKRQRNHGNSKRHNHREFTTVNCAKCGIQTQIPFKPSQGRPVYCKNCYKNSN